MVSGLFLLLLFLLVSGGNCIIRCRVGSPTRGALTTCPNTTDFCLTGVSKRARVSATAMNCGSGQLGGLTTCSLIRDGPAQSHTCRCNDSSGCNARACDCSVEEEEKEAVATRIQATPKPTFTCNERVCDAVAFCVTRTGYEQDGLTAIWSEKACATFLESRHLGKLDQPCFVRNFTLLHICGCSDSNCDSGSICRCGGKKALTDPKAMGTEKQEAPTAMGMESNIIENALEEVAKAAAVTSWGCDMKVRLAAWLIYWGSLKYARNFYTLN